MDTTEHPYSLEDLAREFIRRTEESERLDRPVPSLREAAESLRSQRA